MVQYRWRTRSEATSARLGQRVRRPPPSCSPRVGSKGLERLRASCSGSINEPPRLRAEAVQAVLDPLEFLNEFDRLLPPQAGRLIRTKQASLRRRFSSRHARHAGPAPI